MFYNIFFILSFILILIVCFNQVFYILEFKYYLKNIKIILLDEDFSKKDNLKLKYNYNLSRVKYIYFVCFSIFLKFYFKKYKNLEYLEI